MPSQPCGELLHPICPGFPHFDGKTVRLGPSLTKVGTSSTRSTRVERCTKVDTEPDAKVTDFPRETRPLHHSVLPAHYDSAAPSQDIRGSFKMRLLLIEENEQLSQLLSKELEAAGFSAEVVTTVAEGQKILATTHYSAIVLDLGLPDGDGLSVLRELRGRGDPTPVLILTAKDGVQDRVTVL